MLGTAEAGEPLAFIQGETYPATTSPESSAGYHVTVGRLKLQWPVPLNQNRTLLLPGVNYEQLTLQSDDPSAGDISLRSVMGEAKLVHQLNDASTVVSTLAGGVASNLKGGTSGDDWAIEARLIGMHRFSSKLTLGLGLGYESQPNDLSFIPLGILLWLPGSRWRVSATLPKRAQISYRTSRWLTTNFQIELDSNRFHVDESTFEVDNLYVQYLTIKAGPGLTFSPNPFLHVDVYTGLAFARRYSGFVDERSFGFDFYVNGEDPVRELTFDPCGFVGAMIWMGRQEWTSESSDVREE